MFGASIMLIAQTYHISGNPGDAVLLWGAGVFVAAVLMRSTASLIFAILLLALWLIFLLALWLIFGETEGPSIAMWQFAVTFGLCAAAVWRRRRSSPSMPCCWSCCPSCASSCARPCRPARCACSALRSMRWREAAPPSAMCVPSACSRHYAAYGAVTHLAI